jgi:hypothetical protein
VEWIDPVTFPPSILAAFVTPALAAIGAGAMAVPILIHLLARRRFKRIRWAAMEFLIDAERRNRRRIRMEEWILLAMRCLAVLLLGFLVARPFLSPGAWASAWGGTRRTERIVVIDDSFSMGLTRGDDSPFARSRAAVRRLVDSFRQESPDDALTILRTSAPSAPLVLGAYLDAGQAENALARVEALAVSQYDLDLGTVTKAVADLLGRDAGIVDASVYIVSDFQRRDWSAESTAGGAPRTDRGIMDPLRAWQERKRSLRVYLVNLGEEEAVNDAVVGLGLRGGRPVAGTTSMVECEVAHYGAGSVGPLPIEVEVGQRAQEPRRLESLGAFQQATVAVESGFLRAGDEFVRVAIPPDSLPIDNVRYAAVEVVSSIRVLIVNGEPSADEYEDEVALLRTALRPEGEVFSGHEVTVVDEASFDATPLAGFHAVILANVHRISETAGESLERFARSGGGVMIFVGDQVDPAAYNATLHRSGDGLLPAALGEIVHLESPTRLVIADRLHPALGAIGSGEDPLGLAQIAFFDFYRSRVTADAKPPPDEPRESPDPARTDRPNIVARFDDPDQSPAIVERKFGEGRVMLLTTTADKEWNLWADHPTYLPILTELLRHLTASGGRRADFRVGSPIELAVETGRFDPTVAVRTPGYPNVPEATATIVADPQTQAARIRWEQADTAGFYQFVLRGLDGAETVRLAAVNVEPTESNLAMADDDDIRQVMDGVPHLYVKGFDRLAGVTNEAKTELWTTVLMAAALVLMSEQFLAFWWGRRR